MSVKIILSDKCSLSPSELGAYSFCRHNTTVKPSNDVSSKDTKLYLDLEEYRKNCENLPPDSVLTVPVNFGVVPVDRKVFYDISLTHPRVEQVPRVLQLEYENSGEEKFDDVFWVTFANTTGGSCGLNNKKENQNAVYLRGKTEREAKFRVFFQPELPSMLYNDSFTILADRNPMRFQCRGFSEGPSLCFSQNIINFGGIAVGTETKRVIEIHNLSSCVAHFQFDVDNNRSLFKLCPTSGSVASMKTMKLEVTFKPEKPQCYYKRLYCLVHHQSFQFLDLVGIAMPNTFEFFKKDLYFNINAEDSNFIPFPSVSADEYFKRNLWGVKFHQDHISFGFHDIYSEGAVSSRKLNISSRLPYDVVIGWIKDTSEIFQVVPNECVLPNSGSIDFEFIFSPKFPDSFFSGQMECYIYPVGSTWPPESGPPWVCGNDKSQKQSKRKRTPTVHGHSHPHPHVLKGKEKENKKKVKCVKHPAAEDIIVTEDGHETSPITNTKLDKLNYVPLEIRLQQYNNPKGKLILLKPKKEKSQQSSPKKSPKTVDEDGNEGNSPSFPNSSSAHPTVGEKSPLHDKSEEKDSNLEKRCLPGTKDCPDKCNSNENSDRECIRPSPAISDKESVPTRLTGNKGQMNRGDMIHTHELSNYSSTMRKKMAIKMPQSIIEVALPLCRSINVTGHTFGMTNPPYIAQVDVPSRMAMGPTLPQKRVCGTTIIRNKSDLPAFYDVKYIDKKTGYRMKPRCGVIPGGKSQLLLANLSPRLLNTCKYIGKSVININLQDNFQTELIGMAQIPHLTILICYDSAVTLSKGIVCPITIPGCCTDTYIEFINYSRFHYRYILEPKHLDREDWQIFLPTPSRGYLTPNERVRIQWKFVPLESKTYKVCWRFRFSVVKSGNDLTLTKGSDYEMKMYLTGVSQPCTIQASLSHLDFGLVQIFDKETKTFTIKNMGKYTALAKLSLQHEQWLKNIPKGLVTVTPSRVKLAAEESVQISVTVRPTRTDIQKFFIEYQLDLTERDEYGDVLFEAEPVRIVDIQFMGDHAIFKVTDVMMISRHPSHDTEQCWHMFSLTKLNELLAPQRNLARENTIPTIETVSFRFPPAPVNSDPAIITLMLSSVSDSINRNAASHWEIILENAPEEPEVKTSVYGLHGKPSQKHRRSTFFGGDVRDSREFLNVLWKAKVSLVEKPKISSSKPPAAKIRTTKSISYNKDTSFRISRLSTGSENSAALNNNKNFFTVLPNRGTIQNKSGQQVTFKYTYQEVGSHKMTVLLRIYPAIFVWLELCGRTLEPNQPYIQYMYKDIMRLHPVSLSDMDPPIQMFWVYNGGNVPCSYEVNQKIFETWKENNYGHSVMECLNPVGKVPSRSWFPIKLRFSPLEYEKYKVPLTINSENHEETVLTVEGNVSLDSAMQVRLSSICESSCSRKYNIINPLVPVSICPTFIPFQHFIPTGEKCTSIVFVTNLSSKHKMSFSWPDFPIEGGGSITFHPQSKLLEPNEEVTCMIQVKAGKVSATFSCMIRCMIEDETANAQYEEDLEIWMDAQRLWRNKHFTNRIPQTENRKFAMEKMPLKPEKPESFSRVLAVSLYIGTAFGMLDKLPPEEQSKMPFSDPICQPLKDRTNSLATLPFSNHMSEEILSQMLWEIINAPTFKGFARRVSRRQPPFFYEYKDAEEIDEGEGVEECTHVLPTQTTEQILEYTIYNMLQEMANNYSQNGDQSYWHQLTNPGGDQKLPQENIKLGSCFVRFPPS